MQTITREEPKAKMYQGDDFVLLETLPESSYRRAHLPGASPYHLRQAHLTASPAQPGAGAADLGQADVDAVPNAFPLV